MSTVGRLPAPGRGAGAGRLVARFALTPAGHQELAGWVDEVVPGVRVRDELLTKLVLAVRAGLADPMVLIDRQRRADLRELHSVGELARSAAGVAARLAVEGALVHLEADLEWLERCEAAVTSSGPR